jgi:undecaprenyl-diphosphatase
MLSFHFTYLQATVIGLMQGITELFPISSLGHAVLVPAWLGGSWRSFAASNTYLLVAIAFHFASAIALFAIFAQRWLRILAQSIRYLVNRRASSLSWNLLLRLIIGTLPVGILGFVFNDFFQKNFNKPLMAGIFLTLNGFILFYVDRQSADEMSVPSQRGNAVNPNAEIVNHVSYGQALIVGIGQSAALFAGISRFGISMSMGMRRGLSRALAADFAFLLAFPAIFGASLLKLPKLGHHALSGSYGPLLVGCAAAFLATFFAVKFLVNWFQTKTLRPFAIYCLIIGGISIARFAFHH